MKDLAPVYRIRKGNLNHNELSIPFTFGLVYLDEGQYLFEIFFDEDYPIDELYDNHRRELFNDPLTINATIDTGDSLTATYIRATSFEPANYKMMFECYSRVTIEKTIYDYEVRELENSIREPNLHFLKLEGLRMEFSNHTEVKAWRNHSEISPRDLGEYYYDHSICVLQVGWDCYKTMWRKDEDGEILVQFLGPEAQYQSLPYSKYLEIRSDLISIVSFLNGAPVRVRTEYTWAYFGGPKIDSQVKHLYSFKSENNKRHSQFIPLNDSWFQHSNILSRVLMWDFNRYRYWNKKLDLNSIIHTLGNAEQVRSASERVFIQMILLERLSDSYALIHPILNPPLVDETVFSEFKIEVETLLMNYKDRFGNIHYHTIKSRLFGLNDGKRQRTDVKMTALLEGVGIEITESIRKVISEDRHSIIHKGDIGPTPEAFRVTNKILRQVIANLIKYNGPTEDTPQGEQTGPPIWESPDEYVLEEISTEQ